MNCQLFLRFERMAAEQAAGAGASEEMLLVGSLVVGVAGGEHHAFDAEVHHFVEEGADGFWIGAVEERGVGGDAEAALQGFFDGVDGDVVSAFAADGEVVLFALAVHVDAEGQVLAGLEEMDLLLQQQRVGAEIDVFLACDQALDDFVDLRVHERFAAGDGDHGGAAFVDRAEAFFGGEVFLQDVGGILDLAASGAGEVAAEQGLEHEHERVLLAACELLPQDVGRDRPHL